MPNFLRVRVVIALSAVLWASHSWAQDPARDKPLPAGNAVQADRKSPPPLSKPKDFKPHPLKPIPDDPPPHEGP